MFAAAPRGAAAALDAVAADSLAMDMEASASPCGHAARPLHNGSCADNALSTTVPDG